MIFWGFISKNYFMIGYALALIVSLATYKKYFDTALKYFPIIIAYTFLNELLGFLVKEYDEISFFQNLRYSNINEIIYNIYAIIFFLFFFYVYWELIDNSKYKKWIIVTSVLTLLAYAISTFFQNPIETNLFYATAIGSWSLIFCIILYFKDKANKNIKLYQPFNLMFWISVALLIFYSTFPIIYIIGYTAYELWEKYDLIILLRVLIVVMYSLFIIGFIKGRRRAFS